MSWLKIDDGLFLHPKWLRTPVTARALWVTALSYCGKMNTDGHVDSALLPLLGGATEDAEALVASGLWNVVEGGYSFHDFEDYNRTSEQAEVLSETRAEAGRAGAVARWGKANRGEVKPRNSKPMAKNSKPMAKNAPEPEPEPMLLDKSNSSSPLPPTATKPAAAVSGPVKVYDPQTPIPPAVEAFLAEQPDPPRWRSWLLDELRGREYHSLERYALQILRECKRRGGPPDTASRKLRVLSREEATQSIRRGLETVMTQGDGF
jgi:hypothetical protein